MVNFGVMTKSVLTEEFRPKNRIETTNAFLENLLPKEGRKIAPERFLFGNRCDICIFCDRFTQLFDSPIEVKFPQTTVLLLEQEGLYESCGYSLWGRMHPCGACAPGRARKI